MEPQTVHDAMVICGVDDDLQYQGLTKAQRMATNLFDDEFDTCMDKTFDELDNDFKSFSDLATAQGQIRLLPGVKNKIKAFVQWVRDEKRLGRDPTNTPFPVIETPRLLRRYKTHAAFIKKSTTMAESAKPTKFTRQTNWNDWAPTFVNYLRCLPGRDGVPLKYVIRSNELPDPTPNPDFIDNYVAMAPLEGEAYVIDAQDVHTILVNLIAGNEDAEAKIMIHEPHNDGCRDFIVLKEHYEGVGINSIDVAKAERIIASTFYVGEKKPHMWWAEFEKRLTWAFNTIDKHEGREVYSSNMRLRHLIPKLKADCLQQERASFRLRMAEKPMTLTYDLAMRTCRNTVNALYPPEVGTGQRVRRDIRETTRYEPNPRPRNPKPRNRRKTRQDSTWITLTNRKEIEYHPSFKFPPDIYHKMKPTDKDRLRQERSKWKKDQETQRTIKTLQQQLSEAHSQTNGNTTAPPANVTIDGTSTVSQITTNPGTVMGGRNEQHQRRQNRS